MGARSGWRSRSEQERFECLPELDSLSYYNKKAAKLHATFNLALMHAEVQQPA